MLLLVLIVLELLLYEPVVFDANAPPPKALLNVPVVFARKAALN
jgi:hypothetical protein